MKIGYYVKAVETTASHVWASDDILTAMPIAYEMSMETGTTIGLYKYSYNSTTDKYDMISLNRVSVPVGSTSNGLE